MTNSMLPESMHVSLDFKLKDPYILSGHKPASFEVCRMLREYIDIIDNGDGGQRAAETYTDKHNNELLILVVNYHGHKIPRQISRSSLRKQAER